MKCQNDKCHTEASVLLTQNVLRPTWLCPYCAAGLLRVSNPDSFKTIREKPICDYRKK